MLSHKEIHDTLMSSPSPIWNDDIFDCKVDDAVDETPASFMNDLHNFARVSTSESFK